MKAMAFILFFFAHFAMAQDLWVTYAGREGPGKGKHIVLVDMYAPFVATANYMTALLADKWHPNPAGYQVMSTVWYNAIKGLLH